MLYFCSFYYMQSYGLLTLIVSQYILRSRENIEVYLYPSLFLIFTYLYFCSMHQFINGFRKVFIELLLICTDFIRFW